MQRLFNLSADAVNHMPHGITLEIGPPVFAAGGNKLAAVDLTLSDGKRPLCYRFKLCSTPQDEFRLYPLEEGYERIYTDTADEHESYCLEQEPGEEAESFALELANQYKLDLADEDFAMDIERGNLDRKTAKAPRIH